MVVVHYGAGKAASLRTRDLRPGFFRNAALASLPVHARLLYQGLWCMADKNGRLLDVPALVKADVFPYDNVNVNLLLDKLQASGFIVRYEALGIRCIWIPKFLQHQHPHPKEPDSVLPQAMEEPCTGNGEATETPFNFPGRVM